MIAMSRFGTFLLFVSVVVGYNAQNPLRLDDKVSVLERRINSESNTRSHETAILFQGLDKIDLNVNRSLERYEKQGKARTVDGADKRHIGFENSDLAKTLVSSSILSTVRHDMVKLFQAFRSEKRLHAKMRSDFPKLRNEIEYYQKLTSDLKNESQSMNSIYQDLKTENSKYADEIQQLKRVNVDLQNTNAVLTDDIQNMEDEMVKNTAKQNRETQQLQRVGTDLQNTTELLTDDIKKIKNIIDKYATDIFQIRNKTEQADTTHRTFLSCADALDNGYLQSGVYNLRVSSFSETVKVYCDQVTDGGGWIVFQRRMDGSEDFYRRWEDYKKGFGDLEGEFWLGNENLHAFTSVSAHELRIDMEDFEGDKAYATYNTFKINGESQKYKLEVGGYDGNASDSLTIYHNNMMFSTLDSDNDASSGANCAEIYTGAWWYKECFASNLNGGYFKSGKCPPGKGIIWYYLKTSAIFSLKFVEMKMR